MLVGTLLLNYMELPTNLLQCLCWQQSRFKDFAFEGIDFVYCAAPFEPTAENGVITPKGNPYVRITDLERTVIDCCDRIERAGGIEELLHCMEGISLLDEPKLESIWHYTTKHSSIKGRIHPGA